MGQQCAQHRRKPLLLTHLALVCFDRKGRNKALSISLGDRFEKLLRDGLFECALFSVVKIV